mmetsp:Transcript_24792/g.34156  ORF Transcript_24792/g.34156 Transcript_24792/m.34156 type:complete len:225 (+) Transcript_24792:168-842(+)|eukprot:CAMPEP_0201481586 /NCGR_PEP_ID=MMETSP0151_2-20130828/5861_1 /ASSEMBLY_ACC=CAM_ASM_000257 /TAXON_ID=200890 /ORGANISM="Paramoeba atlantica, Strain 621/1 / CCAP 1560/9" /LENGTH=224 /DNA_ID=CAMNT_0047863871 /DNA_START=168 /DNA_END=842 /DNA_ORIENTATION=-
MGDWNAGFARVEALADEIFADVNERNRMARANVPCAKLTATIKRKIQQLTSEISLLSEDLERHSAAGRVTPKEANRRSDLLESLVSRRDRLVNLARTDGNPDKESLFSGFSPKWESSDTKELDHQALATLQRTKMSEQDQTVDLLADSLAKQHEVAVEIGNELDEHVSLLNSMEGGVDKTTGRVKQQNVKLMKFEDKVKVTGLWMAILVQTVIALVLIILNILN